MISDFRDLIHFPRFVRRRGKCRSGPHFASGSRTHCPGLSDFRSWGFCPGFTFQSNISVPGTDPQSPLPLVWVVLNEAWPWVCCKTFQFIHVCGQSRSTMTLLHCTASPEGRQGPSTLSHSLCAFCEVRSAGKHVLFQTGIRSMEFQS